MHLFATSMVAFGSSLSAFWIMIANGWMHTPSSGHIEAGRYIVDSYKDALLNPNHFLGYAHMWLDSSRSRAPTLGGLWLVTN